VTGFKARFDLVSLEGVLQFAKSFDTLGLFTHTPAEMLVLWESLDHVTGKDEEFAMGVVEPAPEIEPPMQAAYEDAQSRLRRAGISLRAFDLSPCFPDCTMPARSSSIMGARFHRECFHQYGDRLDSLAELVREGLQIPGSDTMRRGGKSTGVRRESRR